MKVLVTGNIYERGLSILRSFADVVLVESSDPALKLAAVRDADALIVRTDIVTAEFIEAGKQLKVIGRFGVGYDNVDVAAATKRKIPVVITPGVNAASVAEHTMGLLLGMTRRVRRWHEHLVEGRFPMRLVERSDDLEGKTLGIVGLGSIGRKVAARARGFDLRVIAHDPVADPKAAAELGVELVSLEDLFKRADFVTLHVPLNPQTRSLVNTRTIQTMKRGSYIINTSRGPVVDLDAAHAALESGQLAGVALDVFPKEPPDLSHPIFKHPNFLGSPHVASHSGALDLMGEAIACTVRDVLQGKRSLSVVNPEVFGRG